MTAEALRDRVHHDSRSARSSASARSRRSRSTGATSWTSACSSGLGGSPADRLPDRAAARPGLVRVQHRGQPRGHRELHDQRDQPQRPGQNQITFQPSINTVSEFKVDNQTLERGVRAQLGAVVNIATRSGTNEFHGEAVRVLPEPGPRRPELLQPREPDAVPLQAEPVRGQPGRAHHQEQDLLLRDATKACASASSSTSTAAC